MHTWGAARLFLLNKKVTLDFKYEKANSIIVSCADKPLRLCAADNGKGVVTSGTDQQPLIGTTVQVKGTGTGTITGIDGDYTLSNVGKNAVLIFSSIGFDSQEIAVEGRTTINVVLKESSELLDEVVVIGYGAVKKSDLTSSIATVKGTEITETVTGNAMDALQGKVNGVQVTSGGGPVLLESAHPWCNHDEQH